MRNVQAVSNRRGRPVQRRAGFQFDRFYSIQRKAAYKKRRRRATRKTYGAKY